MQRSSSSFLACLAILGVSSCGPRYVADNPADLILLNGDVYTMEGDHPWASAIVITGKTITAVLDDDAGADAFRGPETRVIDLEGKFVVPGFIDGHVHFNSAGGLINDANLMAVADNPGLIQEMARLVTFL
ncbi:MAG: amidohydrolase family protein, partial [Desulfobacterales bacterium]|nr:amidohydrolase family protein [Desulfobacterales bacterium]